MLRRFTVDSLRGDVRNAITTFGAPTYLHDCSVANDAIRDECSINCFIRCNLCITSSDKFPLIIQKHRASTKSDERVQQTIKCEISLRRLPFQTSCPTHNLQNSKMGPTQKRLQDHHFGRFLLAVPARGSGFQHNYHSL